MYGDDSDAAADARKRLEAAKAKYEEVSKWVDAEFGRIRKEINAINTENARYMLELTTAGEGAMKPVTMLQPLDGIVRMFPANQLSFGQKMGVYGSRWWEFLFDEPREANSEGGVWPAIFGTVTMTLIMSLAVVPFGVLAALYIREYAKAGPIISVLRIAITNLAGVPSIVFGVFGLGFFCYKVGAFIDGGPTGLGVDHMAPLGWWILLVVAAVTGNAAFFSWLVSMRKAKQFDESSRALSRLLSWASVALWIGCFIMTAVLIVFVPYFDGFFRASLPNPTYGKGGLIWASLTLALLTLPVVIVATEEALSAVPGSMREGAFACGASKWQTIRTIVLPRAMPGIMTGAILAMARGAGEVAPLMLVGAVKLAPHLPIDSVFPYVHPERSFMHLGFHIYDVGFQSQNSEAAKPMVYTTTLLLILIVAVLNLAAIYLRARLRRRFVANQF
ncbi:MAG: ABC transporter permease subunit [Phycisphaera sp.]|nr:ABC transporter permease subunit [Phycisphaera sp.]